MTSRPLLSDDMASTLSSFALANVLLAFDYDGTLAPIAPTPARARMRPTTHRLLQRIARVYPSVVISGRALADIARRLERVPLWYVFGNHGSEPSIAGRRDLHTADWIKMLRRTLPDDPAIVIEDKGHSLTVHYRGAQDRVAAKTAILAAVHRLPDVRVIGGSEAVNVVRRDAPDKGSALAYAVQAFACSTAIYVGDDETDEDAFGALSPDRLLAVRIGSAPASSRARFHLDCQQQIDALLERLLVLREARHVE